MNKLYKLFVGLTLGALLFGCVTTGKGPEWTVKGGGAFTKDKGKVFYGVGRASSEIKDKSLRIEAADNRARADLQRVFDTYTAYLMKDYQGQDGQLIERACKTFAAGHLSGVEIVDHYTDKDGMMNALAKLDLETFRKAMELAKELSDVAREHLRKRSDALFEQLEKEEGKR
ncbi:MAG: hypothetical protein ABIJ11_03175 [Elusimicrobiota bacterium]